MRDTGVVAVEHHPPIAKVNFIYYCDGGFSKTKYPESPAYGSYILKKELYPQGFAKPLIKWDDQRHINHPVTVSTTQQAEVATLLWLLKHIKKTEDHLGRNIQIIMDSAFTLNGVQDKYKVKNKPLIEMLSEAKNIMKSCDCNFDFMWIPGIEMKKILGH